MQPHVKNYLESVGKSPGETIMCEVCLSVAVDVHHIIPRSKFGKKRKKEQDEPGNLIALCRSCHDKAHANILTKEYLFEIVEKRLNLSYL